MVNQTMDIFTLGAIPPYNRLLAGKMMVYAASSSEIYQAYRNKYVGAITLMRDRVIPPNLVMLTTTSAYGRSSIYSRVTYPGNPDGAGRARAIATELGYTKGYGNFHLDALYPDIKELSHQTRHPGQHRIWPRSQAGLAKHNPHVDNARHRPQRAETWYTTPGVVHPIGRQRLGIFERTSRGTPLLRDPVRATG